jgi:hypothetical protein
MRQQRRLRRYTPSRRGVSDLPLCKFFAQSRQGQRTQRQSEVSERDVVKAWIAEQIYDDGPEPGEDDPSTDFWFESDYQACNDFDDADQEHKIMPANGRQLSNPWCQVHIPVGEISGGGLDQREEALRMAGSCRCGVTSCTGSNVVNR